MTDRQLAFVLSGGGSRGALQIGALYALLEAGWQPDLFVGTSIGAANASFLALHGYSRESLDQLTKAYYRAAELNLLPTNYLWLTMRAMLRTTLNDPSQQLRDFFIEWGLTPELTFGELQIPRLVIVSADLNSGEPVLHGHQPGERVLEALLLSTTLPPWFMPVEKQDKYLVDGGIISNLPVEAALKSGATEIVALDLLDTRPAPGRAQGVSGFLERLVHAVSKREGEMEIGLARALGVPLTYLDLTAEAQVAIWDFQFTDRMIQEGYETARQMLAGRGDAVNQ